MFWILKNSKVFKKIRISNRFRVFNPFWSCADHLFHLWESEIDWFDFWMGRYQSWSHSHQAKKAYGNETNWKIGFILDLKSIIYPFSTILDSKLPRACGKLGLKWLLCMYYEKWIFLFQFWHKSDNSLPKMNHFNPFQTEWIKLNHFWIYEGRLCDTTCVLEKRGKTVYNCIETVQNGQKMVDLSVLR